MKSHRKSLVPAVSLLFSLAALILPAVVGAAQGPPRNLEPPQIQGVSRNYLASVTVGETLHAMNGKWEGEPSTYAYQWLHCHTQYKGATVECDPIPGATSPEYSLTASDLNVFMGIEVTATNAFGSASARDTHTGPLVLAPYATLKAHPGRRTTSTHTKFTFAANAPNATFECKLDQEKTKPCRSPFQANLKPGPHVFRVIAVGPGGARPKPPAIPVFHWRILPSE